MSHIYFPVFPLVSLLLFHFVSVFPLFHFFCFLLSFSFFRLYILLTDVCVAFSLLFPSFLVCFSLFVGDHVLRLVATPPTSCVWTFCLASCCFPLSVSSNSNLLISITTSASICASSLSFYRGHFAVACRLAKSRTSRGRWMYLIRMEYATAAIQRTTVVLAMRYVRCRFSRMWWNFVGSHISGKLAAEYPNAASPFRVQPRFLFYFLTSSDTEGHET